MRTTRHSQRLSGGKPSPACLHTQQQLPLLLDGELSEAQAQSLLRHLSACPVCQREREQWQQAERALASARQYVPAPGDLRAGFYARLAAAPSNRRLFPRIDWRVAVPALAACGLAVGWFTTQRPVVPSTTETSSFAYHQQIAQANIPPVTKPAVSEVLANVPSPYAASNSKVTERAQAHVSSSLAQAASHTMRSGLQGKKRERLKSLGWQIALLDSRRSQPKLSSRLEPRRPASVASLAFAYRSAKQANTLGERLTGEQPARLKSGRQEAASLADAQTVMNESLLLSKVSPKKKAAPSTDNNVLAETSNRVANTDRYDYSAQRLNSREFGELKEQAALPAPTSDSPANTDQFQTFALGLSAGAKLDTNVLHRGLGWQLAAGGSEGVELQVRDTKRGFTNGTRLVGEVQEQNGRRVLIIQAEDAEPSADAASE